MVQDEVDYELVDKIMKRMKFFKIFEKDMRMKMYKLCRYQIVPPYRIIG